MDIITRIRINLNTREVEWEGSESFIEKYQSTINEFINKVKDGNSQDKTVPYAVNTDTNYNIENEKEITVPIGNRDGLKIPESFGELYAQFPRAASVSDKMLIAAFFVQSNSQDGLFLPREAANILDEQNVQVTNPNSFVKSLQKTAKVYKQAGKFKVHEKGIEYLKELLQQGW